MTPAGDATVPGSVEPVIIEPGLVEQVVVVGTVVSVETDASVWLIGPTSYCRSPRITGIRPATPSVDDALVDASWHDHVGVWAHLRDGVVERYRILPAGRPVGSVGILTGVLATIAPDVDVPE